MDLREAIEKARDGLEKVHGLYSTWEISDGIVNVYSQPVKDEPTEADTANYLYTVTVTVTP